MLRSTTLIRGFNMGDSIMFLSWPGFSASPDLSPLCRNISLLPRHQLRHQEKLQENEDVGENLLILGLRPLCWRLLWLNQ
jgi:hypothetical protein